MRSTIVATRHRKVECPDPVYCRRPLCVAMKDSAWPKLNHHPSRWPTSRGQISSSRMPVGISCSGGTTTTCFAGCQTLNTRRPPRRRGWWPHRHPKTVSDCLPDAVCSRSSRVDFHHCFHRSHWAIQQEGKLLLAGFDVTETDEQEKLLASLAFLATLPKSIRDGAQRRRNKLPHRRGVCTSNFGSNLCGFNRLAHPSGPHDSARHQLLGIAWTPG